MLVSTYRNGPEGPGEGGGRASLGRTEWRDVEAFVSFALDEGGEDVVLVGLGAGGSIAASLVHESETAEGTVHE